MPALYISLHISSSYWSCVHQLTYLFSFLTAEMGKLNSFITMKPPKSSRAKKDTASEKEKESLSPVHETLPEVGVVAAEPAVPRKTRYSKKSSAPKEQGIVLKEVPSEKPKSSLVPAGEKAKRSWWKKPLLLQKGRK